MSLSARKIRRLSAAEYLAADNDGTWRSCRVVCRRANPTYRSMHKVVRSHE
jgi:hypothetical protein